VGTRTASLPVGYGGKRSRVKRGLPKRWSRWWPCRVESGPARGMRIISGGATDDYCRGTNEIPVQEALVDVLEPGDVFFDIGANVGFFTLLAARLVGTAGTVIAFEPVPRVRRVLRLNTLVNRRRNVRVRREAVAATDGPATLVLAAHMGGAALEAAGAPPDAVGTFSTRTVALDTLVRRQIVPPPDLVKIDVEGAEHLVLLGMQSLLSTAAPSLLIEFDGPTEADVRAKVDTCVELLRGLRYRVEKLSPAYSMDAWSVEHVLAHPESPPNQAEDMRSRSSSTQRSIRS
jgi:FkbM family methyltransferase